MQLTTFTDYGLRSLMYLAVGPISPAVWEIAQRYGISRNHLVKVVHRLAQLGYVATTKGKGGGIRLACNPNEVRLGDLIEELEPHMHIVECFDEDTNNCLIIDGCRLKRYLHGATRSFLENLNQHTLADASANRGIFKNLNDVRPI